MTTLSSFSKLCAGLAFIAVSMSSTTRLLADDGEAATEAPPVPSPQAAPAGEGRTQVRGQIIIVDPDGTRREYNLGPQGAGEADFDIVVPRPPYAFFPGGAGDRTARVRALRTLIDEPQVVVGDYMIGLDCVPAEAALRAQLGLGEKGLVVRSPLEKSPAAEAGLQAHDVLIKAGDKDLMTVQNLMDAVQAADGKPLTITLLRGGKEQTLDVTPKKRMDVTVPPPGPNFADFFWREIEHPDFPPGGPLHTLRMHAVRPGVVFEDRVEFAGPEKLNEIESRIQQLTEQVQALQKSIDELKQK